MVFNNKKKGQAAIEFLMTYGWMLLVVLIVGALIFSFIDFNSLLPNKVDLNNNLRAAQTESYASMTAGSAATTSHAVVTFYYQGTPRVTLNGTDVNSVIQTDLDGSCNLSYVYNADTGEGSVDPAPTYSGLPNPGPTNVASAVTFINGQIGVAVYYCGDTSHYNNDNGFRSGDVLEGKIKLIFRNAKTQVPVPSSGTVRLTINEN